MHKDKKIGVQGLRMGVRDIKMGLAASPNPTFYYYLFFKTSKTLMGLFLFLFLLQPPHHHATTPRHHATPPCHATMPPRHRRRFHRRDPQPSTPTTTGGVADKHPSPQILALRFFSHARDSVVTTTTRATPSTLLFTSGFVDVEASFSIYVAFGTPTPRPTVMPPPPLEASTRHQRCHQRFFFVSWFYRFRWHWMEEGLILVLVVGAWWSGWGWKKGIKALNVIRWWRFVSGSLEEDWVSVFLFLRRWIKKICALFFIVFMQVRWE